MKANKTTTTYNDLIRRYPLFFDDNENSIHSRYNRTLASILSMYRRDRELVKLSKNLNRPLQIWRDQLSANNYTIHYKVELEGLKHVRLYKESANDEHTLIHNHEARSGVTIVMDEYSAISDEIIPNERYYLEAETIEGFIFQKGFPENDTIKYDIYDHDSALDRIGLLYDIPRQKYKIDVETKSYPYTFPPYNVSRTEWDYYYEHRIRKHVQEYNTRSLVELELEKMFNINPVIEGRWRHVAHMDIDVMDPEKDAKYMACPQWDSSVFNVGVNLKNLPRNVIVPEMEDIEKILKKAFPLGSEIVFTVNKEFTEEKGMRDEFSVDDTIDFECRVYNSSIIDIKDDMNYKLSLNKDEDLLESLKLDDKLNLGFNLLDNVLVEDKVQGSLNIDIDDSKINKIEIIDSVSINLKNEIRKV